MVINSQCGYCCHRLLPEIDELTNSPWQICWTFLVNATIQMNMRVVNFQNFVGYQEILMNLKSQFEKMKYGQQRCTYLLYDIAI